MDEFQELVNRTGLDAYKSAQDKYKFCFQLLLKNRVMRWRSDPVVKDGFTIHLLELFDHAVRKAK